MDDLSHFLQTSSYENLSVSNLYDLNFSSHTLLNT